ncbi:MAG: AtpZ/AtpI family protein [Bacteroidales bacterium]|nr:AtpZ/AtpI family protein [Bacteroidales bacterium]
MKVKKPDELRKIGKYLNMPFQMLAIIGLGVFGGIKLDKLLNLNFPVFTIILAILSVVLAIYVVVKDLIK